MSAAEPLPDPTADCMAAILAIDLPTRPQLVFLLASGLAVAPFEAARWAVGQARHILRGYGIL